MFSSQQRLKERTGQHGTPRLDYLQELVNEFQSTKSKDAKEQVVANLANFAYDPINYDHLRALHVIDLFIDCLTEPNERLREFGMGGLCNCCNDPLNAAPIIAHAIPDIISCLDTRVQNTVLSAITTLYYLCTPLTKQVICTPDVMSRLHGYAEGEGVNTRITNVARVFLERHGGRMAERWDESESFYRTERFVEMTHTCLPAVFAGEGEKHRLAALS